MKWTKPKERNRAGKKES